MIRYRYTAADPEPAGVFLIAEGPFEHWRKRLRPGSRKDICACPANRPCACEPPMPRTYHGWGWSDAWMRKSCRDSTNFYPFGDRRVLNREVRRAGERTRRRSANHLTIRASGCVTKHGAHWHWTDDNQSRAWGSSRLPEPRLNVLAYHRLHSMYRSKWKKKGKK